MILISPARLALGSLLGGVMNRILRGALVGGAAGLVVGILGEFAVLLVLELFPTDVLISGFAVIWAVPLGVCVGSVTAWRGWLDHWQTRALVAAVPGLLAGFAAAWIQWSSV